VNNRVYHQPYRIAVIVTLVLVSVLFTTACSAVPQSTEPDKKNNSSETKETQPELNVDDFAKIIACNTPLRNRIVFLFLNCFSYPLTGLIYLFGTALLSALTK
jgi:hypothetical protein